MSKDKKLLLIGGSNGNAHLRNFHDLIFDYFDDILVVSNTPIDFAHSTTLYFGLRNPIQFYKNIKALKSIIKEFQPTIIHVHQANSYALMTVLANTMRIPIVLTTWGSDILLLPKKGFLYRAMVRYVLKKAVVITADANYMATAIHDLIGKKEVIIANFGVAIDTNTTDIARKKIIYSNRMHAPLYQIEKIILECARFLKENPDWSLKIAGQGLNSFSLEKLAAENLSTGSYQFVGFLSSDENKANYHSASIYVSIPTSDGTSISLLEAMAYGCIPIVSDLPANKEWITHLENGIISSENLTKDLEMALGLDMQIVRLKNELIIESRASKENSKQLFLDLYTKL